MKRYEGDIKEQAIARMQEIGVKRTGEELGISIQTLYKWRNEKKDGQIFSKEQPIEKMEEMIRMLKSDDDMDTRILQLEAENAELRKSVAQMRRALISMLE